MLRFRQHTRRDNVVSLLPPISIMTSQDSSIQERIYSDSPPPITYTGSFPAKILRHLDKSIFYSTPTKGEELLASKTMHDLGHTTKENSSDKNISQSLDKESHIDDNTKRKSGKNRAKTKKRAAKNFDGMREKERRCLSAPGRREAGSGEQVSEAWNLTAPVTPRLNAPANDSRLNAEEKLRIGPPTRGVTTPMGVAPDNRFVKQFAEFGLELRIDGIEKLTHANELRAAPPTYARPNSRSSTPYRHEWPKTSDDHQNACAEKVDREQSKAIPKIRTVMREAPYTQRQAKATKESPKFEIRAVGYSLTVHDKNDLKSESNLSSRMKDSKRNESSKNSKIPKDKTIKISSVVRGNPTTALPIVMESDVTSKDSKSGPDSASTTAQDLQLKEMDNTTEDGHTVMEKIENESNEKTEKNWSEKLEESPTKKPETELNEPATENMNITTDEKKKQALLGKKDRKKSKTKVSKK